MLELLAEFQHGATLSSLCDGAHLNGSTTHRLLATLAARGYVRQDPATKKYLLGPQTLHLGQAGLAQFDLRNIAHPHLRKLAHEANELANLVLLSETHAVYMAQVQAGQRTVQMFTQLGARVPLHCTGVGKAILAFLPEDEVEHLLASENLKAYTPYTITNVFLLREELEKIRQHGYAVDNEEREIGVRCIAAPVFQARGRVLAAVSLSGPAGRINPDRDEELGQLVQHAAERISSELGYQGNHRQTPEAHTKG